MDLYHFGIVCFSYFKHFAIKVQLLKYAKTLSAATFFMFFTKSPTTQATGNFQYQRVLGFHGFYRFQYRAQGTGTSMDFCNQLLSSISDHSIIFWSFNFSANQKDGRQAFQRFRRSS